MDPSILLDKSRKILSPTSIAEETAPIAILKVFLNVHDPFVDKLEDY